MKFTANRKVMLEHLKTMVRIVPTNSPIHELNGFLIEANEDDGFLYMTATNMEAAIQRKFKPEVETGGIFVLSAKLLVDVLDYLNGESVSFEEKQKGTVTIKSGECTYTLRVLDGKKYPKPEIPFPNTMVHISDVRKFYLKTNGAAAKTNENEVLKGIHFDITNEMITVVGCNQNSIAKATKKMNCGGELSFTLTKEMLSYLSAAASDDELEVGVCGNAVIFAKEGLLFSARRLAHEYVNVDMIFNNLQTDYVATADFEELKEKMLNTCSISSMGSETSYIKFDFSDDKITMTTKNDTGDGINEVKATKVQGVSGQSYYYRSQALRNIFKTVEGTLVIRLDKKGYLVVMDQFNQFLLTAVSDNLALRQLEKYEEKKSKRTQKSEEPKKDIKTKKSQKAKPTKDGENEIQAAA